MRPQLSRFALAKPASTSFLPSIQLAPRQTRPLSTPTNDARSTTSPLNPRYLSDLKTRIGKCITFGLDTAQTKEACSVLEEIALDWRGLVAGTEGFLTDKQHAGLYRQEVVWGEMDSMGTDLQDTSGHVNNVMYNRYAESARVNWTRNFAEVFDPVHKTEWRELMTPRGIGLILRSIRTDYKFPLTWPDRVTVLHKLKNEPKPDADHFILDVVILSEVHRRVAARCWEDIVVYDYRAAKKAPLKPFMVEKFKETWQLQEQAKQTYGQKASDLIRRVRELEKNSWDNADAKEDVGSAANR